MSTDSSIPTARLLRRNEKYLNGKNIIATDRSLSIVGYFSTPLMQLQRNGSILPFAEAYRPVVSIDAFADGVECHAYDDGLFLFDLSKWEFAPELEIPGYVVPDGAKAHYAPVEHEKAHHVVDNYCVIRAQLMNVHQALLETRLGRRVLPLMPIVKRRMVQSRCFPHNAMVAGSLLRESHARYRPESHKDKDISVELSEIAASFGDLKAIIALYDIKVVELIDALYTARWQKYEGQYGQSLMLSWTVCEQIVFILLNNYIKKETENESRLMDSSRIKKLKSRDMTASIAVEILDFAGLIDKDAYAAIEVIRRCRNKWAHEMKMPSESDVMLSNELAQLLINYNYNQKLKIRI